MPRLRVPHFIPHDKENLLHEIQRLKVQYNDLKNEHKLVKTANIMLEVDHYTQQ